MTRRPTVLVLRALKLGDLLTGVPALRALRDAFPRHEIVLLAPRWLEPLVAHVGVCDRLVDHRGLSPVPPELSAPDVAVDLHGCGPESQRLLLDARPGRLVAFRHPHVPETAGMARFSFEEHEVTRWCRMLHESGIPADPGALGIEAPDAPGAGAAPGCVLVHPGAASAARRWPLERFVAVVRALREAGRAVLVTGGPGEEELAGELAARSGLAADSVRTRLGLLELAGLVARAKAVLCGDTGIAHLGFALSTPSVVLYGPTAPHRWGPPPNDGRHRALWTGGTGDPHGGVVDPGLAEISVADVLRALEQVGVRLGPANEGPHPTTRPATDAPEEVGTFG